MALVYYKAILNSILKHLARYNDPVWTRQLPNWILLIDKVEGKKDMETFHLRRTQKTLIEQWSSGYLLICPVNGHQIPSSKEQMDTANRKLCDLMVSLNQEINGIYAARGLGAMVKS